MQFLSKPFDALRYTSYSTILWVRGTSGTRHTIRSSSNLDKARLQLPSPAFELLR
ncbi:hypothetical protein [Paenibacillus sp. 1001270B_150601_E10]|uniref:hypothetical protein n=1 Tax=Paenibacillus sp. 1001270B_150601_E10 TaxID=2787079 RepID=UPI00189F08AD|nr:hypothetical protein [Paenibacillus sp. 1001270B_150601_E10]